MDPTTARAIRRARISEIRSRMEHLSTYVRLSTPQQSEVNDLGEELERLIDEETRAAQRDSEVERVRSSVRGSTSGITTEREVLERQQPREQGRPRRTGLSPNRSAALDLLSTIERSHGNRSRLDWVAGLIEGEPDESFDPDEVARYVRAAGSPAYLSAFLKAHRSVVASGSPAMAALEMTDDERAAWQTAGEYMRAVGLSGTGQLLVPFQLDPTVNLTNAGTSGAAGIRAVASVRQATSNVYRALSSAGVTAGYVAEAAELADAAPVIGSKDITVHKGAAFVPVSYEAAQDAGDIESTLAAMLLDGKDRAEATAFVKGTGTGQPWGMATRLVTDSKTVNTTGTGVGYTGVALGDIYALKQAVPARWRANGSWLVSDLVVDGIRRISETAANANSYLVEGIADDTPSRLLGRRMTETTELDDGDGANGESVAVFGDLRQYVIADRLGATLEVSASSLLGPNGRPTLQRGYTLYWRNGADFVVSDAARVLRS